jgi:hypothetical protein
VTARPIQRIKQLGDIDVWANRVRFLGEWAPPPAETTIDGITYKIASNRQDREASFRLVYEAYTHCGLMQPNPFGMRVTPFHLLPTTDVFIATFRGEAICTLSLVGDGELGVPMESIYKREVISLRERGLYFGEVSCFAERRPKFNDFLPVFVNLSSLVMQYARRNGMDQLLIVTHPRHERFYGRLLGFERLGAERVYPSVCDRPAVASSHEFDRLDRVRYPLYDEIYRHIYPFGQLQPQPMPETDRDYFRPATEACNSFIPIAA